MKAKVLDGGKVHTVEGVENIRAERGKVMWIQLGDHDDATDALLRELGLHDLTIEDIWEERNAPKVEDYDSYLYVLLHGLRPDPKAHKIRQLEIDVVVSKTWVITRDPGDLVTSEINKECARSSKLLEKGTAWIAHAMFDHLVDSITPMIDDFDEKIEVLEDDVLDKAGTPEGRKVLERILGFKRELQSMRRMGIHQREILLRISRGEFEDLIPQEVLPFMRDVYDHFVRVSDMADGYRDLVTSALDAYLSVQSNRMNEVMKTLTLISTMFLPLAFMAGVWGMNFKHMPELEQPWGYAAALGSMAFVAISIFIWFAKRGWLKRQS